jgi:hypothetical protein
LKLSNALVRRGDGDLPDLFVADFGIGGLAAGQALREQAGRRVVSSQFLPTALRGAYTPLYASPQQVRGERPDPRDDVHALGVIWYQLVTGDLRLLAIPPDWQDVVEERGLGKELVQVLAACLASRAEKRLVDARALEERLLGCREGVRHRPGTGKHTEAQQERQHGTTAPKAEGILHVPPQEANPAVEVPNSLDEKLNAVYRKAYRMHLLHTRLRQLGKEPPPVEVPNSLDVKLNALYSNAYRMGQLHARLRQLGQEPPPSAHFQLPQAADEKFQDLLYEGMETGCLTYSQVSYYLGAWVWWNSRHGAVELLPDKNQQELDQLQQELGQLLEVLEEQGIELIDDSLDGGQRRRVDHGRG